MTSFPVRLVLGALCGAALLATGCSGKTAGPNRRPVAVAGWNQAVPLNGSAFLDGSGSYDPDGDHLFFLWGIASAPIASAARFTEPSGETTRLGPLDANGLWMVRLIVNDGALDSEPDMVQVRTVSQTCSIDSDCDDGDPCTTQDRCQDGRCLAGVVDKDTDHDGYIDARCPGGNDCNDDNPAINPGVFEGPHGSPLCSDGLDNDCDGKTDGDDIGCQPCQKDGDCDDHDVCNGTEACSQGGCGPGKPLGCDDADPCTRDSCDPALGCRHAVLADGAECGPRTCQGLDWHVPTCQGGQCKGDLVLQSCFATGDCVSATCSPTAGCGTSAAPDGNQCGSRFCSGSDWMWHSCQSGHCTGQEIGAHCDDGLACNGIESCDASTGCEEGQPLADGTPCDEGAGQDGLACNSTCQAGGCSASIPAAEGVACDDHNPCTIQDACRQGVCLGTDKLTLPVAQDGCLVGNRCISVTCAQTDGTCLDHVYQDATRCDGNEVVSCDASGNATGSVTCSLGCNGNTDPERCFQVAPSNVDPNLLCANTTLDLQVNSPQSLDTSGPIPGNGGGFTVVVQGGGLPDIAVYSFNNIHILANVTVTGPRALALLACHDVEILGVITACADSAGAGPGGQPGGGSQANGGGYWNGAGQAGTANTDHKAGGGGGAFGAAGGSGGNAETLLVGGGGGGQAYGSDSVTPLVGGSGGGGGGSGGVGGGGGGAIQITAGGSITITGGINVCGAGGGSQTDDNRHGGGGGGAGGGILIEAPSVTVSGILTANGGGGGGGSEGNNAAGPSQNGQFGTARALGGTGGGDEVGNGGAGGAADAPAGDPGGSAHRAGGGGGGSAGRIRINTQGGSATVTGATSPFSGKGFTQGTIGLY